MKETTSDKFENDLRKAAREAAKQNKLSVTEVNVYKDSDVEFTVSIVVG